MYIYGRNVVREKLNTNDKINKAIISTKFQDQELINLIKVKLCIQSKNIIVDPLIEKEI